MEGSFSLLSLFTGDWMTVFVSIVLVIFSVISWTVIVEKIRLWRMQKRTPMKMKPDENIDVFIRPFDKNLWFLSMVAYISPFIGLFGTVWGVMDSFAAMKTANWLRHLRMSDFRWLMKGRKNRTV